MLTRLFNASFVGLPLSPQKIELRTACWKMVFLVGHSYGSRCLHEDPSLPGGLLHAEDLSRDDGEGDGKIVELSGFFECIQEVMIQEARSG